VGSGAVLSVIVSGIASGSVLAIRSGIGGEGRSLDVMIYPMELEVHHNMVYLLDDSRKL
jgi:hypothetical protein